MWDSKHNVAWSHFFCFAGAEFLLLMPFLLLFLPAFFFPHLIIHWLCKNLFQYADNVCVCVHDFFPWFRRYFNSFALLFCLFSFVFVRWILFVLGFVRIRPLHCWKRIQGTEWEWNSLTNRCFTVASIIIEKKNSNRNNKNNNNTFGHFEYGKSHHKQIDYFFIIRFLFENGTILH